MRAVLAGAGAVGTRVAQQLAASDEVESLVIIHRDPRRLAALAARLADRLEIRSGLMTELPEADVTVLATPGPSRRAAEIALQQGSHVVALSDDPADVRALLGLDAAARSYQRTLVVGAAMAPGLSCVLASHLRRRFDEVEEVHVASYGTGGPACARRHHAALTSLAVDWEDGDWRRRPGGSGRELVWFPEPVGGADCYRAGLADALVLEPAFPGSRRVTSRMAATRRDRLTSWLPMLRPPHPEGLLGAVRVELRGWRGGRAETEILGAVGPPAAAAAAVTTEAARWAIRGDLARAGAAGLAELVGEPSRFLRDVVGSGPDVTVAAFYGGYSDI